MKAWMVKEKDGEYATVVFAETRGKARALARCTDACADADFCDIEVSRKPQLDKYYRDGKKEMSWYNDKERLALVKECGFQCEDMEIDECEVCSAKEHCGLYQQHLDDMEYEDDEAKAD